MKLKPLALAVALIAPSVWAQTEIQWWHSMTAVNNEWVNGLAKQFNESQKTYKLNPIYKGSYDESMTAAIAAFRAGNAPHILQVFEVGTATMMASKGAIVPAGKVMADAGYKFDPKAYISAVSGYYTAPNGQMLSFPLNSSTTVFYYNKDAFKAAGMDPEKAPSTWPEVALAAAKLKASGHKCPLSIAWQGWTQLESFSAWHNVDFASKSNGLGGMDARLKFNSPLHVRHIENLGNMAKQGLFIYKGRRNVPEPAFISGECAMMSTSSGFRGNVAKNAKFAWGMGSLPYYPDVPGAPQNTVIGGASLWVLAGKKPEEYKGVAKFFTFLSDTDRQMKLHIESGYLPITNAAYDKTRASGFYDKNPGRDTPLVELNNKPPTENSRGLRFGNMVQIRDMWAEEIESALQGSKPPQKAMDDAVARGNAVLRQFEKSVSR